MIDRPASHRQLDLLVSTPNALEPSRAPRSIRVELTVLLKLLMSEHIAAGAAPSPEAGNE